MLKNAYFLAKIDADTAENEQQFAELLPIGRRVPDHASSAGPPPSRRPPPQGQAAPRPARAAEFTSENYRRAPACHSVTISLVGPEVQRPLFTEETDRKNVRRSQEDVFVYFS